MMGAHVLHPLVDDKREAFMHHRHPERLLLHQFLDLAECLEAFLFVQGCVS